MTKEQFKNYNFSISTQIKFQDMWHDVFAIDFAREEIEIEMGSVEIDLIQNIREK